MISVIFARGKFLQSGNYVLQCNSDFWSGTVGAVSALEDLSDDNAALTRRCIRRVNIDMTTESQIATALEAHEFNDALPDDWANWPTRIELAYTLTLGGAVTSESYSRFRVESLYEAVRYLFDPVYRRRYFRYSLKTDGFLPAYQYDAEWSLLRRGSTGGVSRRKREQRVEPWSFGADTTLLEIWREPLTEYTFEGRLWLRTGGRTKDDAVQNWLVSARLLRKVYRLSSELARSPD